MSDTTTSTQQPKSRRRRVILGALLGTVGAGLIARMAVGAPPCDGPHRRWRDADPAVMRQHIEDRVQRMLQKVKATNEQETRILAIVDQTFTDLEPFRTRRESAHQKARELLSQPTIDRAAIDALRTAQVQTFDAVSKRITQALEDAAEVLTPAQRTALADELATHRGHGPF